jgi:chromosomal replication initiator protein
MVVLDPLAVPAAIQSIRRQVCEHFYLRERRDPELTVRTNRRAFVLPRQIAMYIARQLTGATLQEIGREFGGRHHTTTLYAIRKIERMRRSDGAMDSAIRGLTNDIVSAWTVFLARPSTT